MSGSYEELHGPGSSAGSLVLLGAQAGGLGAGRRTSIGGPPGDQPEDEEQQALLQEQDGEKLDLDKLFTRLNWWGRAGGSTQQEGCPGTAAHVGACVLACLSQHIVVPLLLLAHLAKLRNSTALTSDPPLHLRRRLLPLFWLMVVVSMVVEGGGRNSPHRASTSTDPLLCVHGLT